MKTLPDSGWLEQLRFYTGRRRVVEVVNESMLPTLQPGDTLLYDPRAYRRTAPAPGDLVVVAHPQRPELRLVKRVSALLAGDRVEIRGDNAARSEDSRHFGPVARSALAGRITSRLP